MRKTSSLLLALGLFSATAATAQVNLNNGLLAYYPFTNGSMLDASGNSRVLLNVGATPDSSQSGVPNDAYYFAGDSNSYMQMSATAGVDFKGDFTICMKVKPMGYFQGPCHGNALLHKSEDANGEYAVGMLFDDNYYSGGTNCSNPTPDTLHQNFYIVKTHQGAAYTTYNISKPPFALHGEWHSLVMMQKGDSLYQYIDNDLLNVVPSLSYTGANANDIFFGKTDNRSSTFFFKGVMDEIRFYDRALSDSEVLAYRRYNPLAVAQVEAPASVTLAPNPATDVLRLTNPSAKEVSFRVLDLQGREMLTGKARSGETSLPVSHLSSGMYLVQLQSDKGALQTLRFIKN